MRLTSSTKGSSRNHIGKRVQIEGILEHPGARRKSRQLRQRSGRAEGDVDPRGRGDLRREKVTPREGNADWLDTPNFWTYNLYADSVAGLFPEGRCQPRFFRAAGVCNPGDP